MIGLIGRIRSGKDTFVQLLREIRPAVSLAHFNTGDFLGELCRKCSLEDGRENKQKMAKALDAYFGEGTLTRAMAGVIGRDESCLGIYNSVRWESDLQLVRGESPHLLVHIKASQRLRWERARLSAGKSDEIGISFEEFCARETVSTETEIDRIASLRDVITIDNDTSKAALTMKVRAFWHVYIEPIIN